MSIANILTGGILMKRINGFKPISKLIALFMVVLMLLSGCGTSTGNDTKTTAEATKVVAQGSTAAEPEKPLYTIKVFSQATIANVLKTSDETPIYKKIKDKFNINFEFVPFSGNAKDQQNLLLASGDYPELMDLQELDTFTKYKNAAALIPLDPYMDKLPDFKELYKDCIPYWKLQSGDGKLWKWEKGVPFAQEALGWADIAIRSDILEEAGYPQLLNSDDYIKLLTDAMKKHPQTDGKKTVGMAVPFAEAWGIAGIGDIMYEKGRYVQLTNGATIFNAADEKWEDRLKVQYAKEGFQFFNKLYNAGLITRESFTDKMDQCNDKLNSGRALSIWFMTWSLPDANAKLKAAGKEGYSYLKLPIQSPGQIANKETRYLATYNTKPFDTCVITKNAKYPERIIELLNYACSDEGMMLLESGIENVHYKVENGKRVPTQEYIDGKKNDADYAHKQGFELVDMFGIASVASKNDNQLYNLSISPEVNDLLLPKRVMDTYKALGWNKSSQWWNDNAKVYDVSTAISSVIDPTTELGALEAKIVDLRTKWFAKVVMSKDDAEFEKNYAKLLEEHEKLQPQKVVDEYNRLYAEGKTKLNQYK